MSFSKIIEDIYLMDFYERKNRTSLLIGHEEVSTMSRCLQDIKFTNRTRIKVSLDKDLIGRTLTGNYYYMYKLLALGNGIISLCGLSILDIIAFPCGKIYSFSLYFHSCTEEEANKLLFEYAQLLNMDIYHNLDKDVYLIVSNKTDYFIEVSRKVYANREEVLLNIGPNPEKHGWDPIANYFCTVSAALINITGMFPIEPMYLEKDFEEYISREIQPVFYSIGEANSFGKRYSILEGHDFSLCQGSSIQIYNYVGKIVYVLESIERNGCCYTPEAYLSTPKVIEISRCQPLPFTILNTKSYFGEKYETTTVGIDGDSFIAFANCCKKFNIGNDLFLLLCSYWFDALGKDTKMRLAA